MIRYPAAYLLCPVCRATAGYACRALSGAIIDGVPDGTITPLERPHKARKVSRRALANG